MKFGMADTALVPLQEGLRDVRARHKGLSYLIGLPAAEARQQMELEHASQELFCDVAHGITTSAAKEWAHVLAAATAAGGETKEGEGAGGGRKVVPLQDLMQLREVRAAGLREEEVLGLRLYTGPMHDVYNEVLRSVHKVEPYTINEKQARTDCLEAPTPALRQPSVTVPVSLSVRRHRCLALMSVRALISAHLTGS